jgi:hypothetical protein
MIFKLIFGVSVLSTFLLSGESIYLQSQKRDILFSKDEVANRTGKSVTTYRSVYYLYGVESKETEFISNGTLVVEFAKGVDIENFVKANNLLLIKRNSTGRYILKDLKQRDIIELSNQLFQLDEVVDIAPNWHRARGLK